MGCTFLCSFKLRKFLILFAVLAIAESFVTYEERIAIIKMATKEVLKNIQERNHSLTSANTALSKTNFHFLSKVATMKAKARLLFEDLITTAERKFIELRNAKVAEYEAMPLVDFKRNPSQVFNVEEIKQLYDVSGCNDIHVYSRTMEAECKGKLYHQLYRSIDGFCNNVDQPEYGTTASELRRLLPTDYENGITSPKGHSQAVCNQTDEFFSVHSKQCESDTCTKGDDDSVGERDFLYESPGLVDPCDGVSGSFTFPLPSTNYIASKLRLAKKPLKLPLSDWSLLWGQFIINDIIIIPDIGDKLYPKCDQCESNAVCDSVRLFQNNIPLSDQSESKCLSIRRSATECRYNFPGKYPPRNQLNDVTAYLDASVVYGSTADQANILRTFKNGTLIEQRISTETLSISPTDSSGDISCNKATNGGIMCGDFCCLDNDPVTSLNKIFVRFHNSLAKELSNLNFEWTDEILYQETRKIVSAVVQKITYQDFLPKIFYGDIFDYLVGQYKGYDSSRNPQVSVAFSDIILMALVFPNNVYNDAFQKDLFSIVIQRGREHGLPSYSKFRKYIEKHLPRISTPKIEVSFLSTLNELYGSIDNVDLLAGALGETSMTTPLGRTALFGETFASIIAMTFKNLRDGDRFFYQKSGMFTRNQLEQINNIELANLLCTFGDSVSMVSSDSFLKNFEVTDCSHLLSHEILDLSHWQEPTCYVKVALLPQALTGQVVGVSILDQPRIRVYTGDVHDQSCLPVTCPLNDERKSSVNLINFLNTNVSIDCTVSTSFSQNKFDNGFLNITLIPSMIDGHLIHRTRKSCEETNLSTIRWKCPENLILTYSDFISIPLPPGV